MRSLAALHADDADTRTTSALLLVVNAIGIPVLAREYGEAHAPPSATVGILSAIHHASTKDRGAALQSLESQHHSVTYHTTRHDLLVVLASDKQPHYANAAHSCSDRTTPRLLATIDAALSVFLPQPFASFDASRQRLLLSKHVDIIDYIVTNFRCDIRLLLGRPLRSLSVQEQQALALFTDATQLLDHQQQRLLLHRGYVTAERSTNISSHRVVVPDAIELVVLAIQSECLTANGVNSTHDRMRLGCASASDGVDVIAVIESSKSLVNHTASIAICNADIQEQELQAEINKLRVAAAANVVGNLSLSLPDALCESLPPTFVCGYATRRDNGAASPACRTISFQNSNWRAVLREGGAERQQSIHRTSNSNDDDQEDRIWSVLCAFVALRLDAQLPMQTMPPEAAALQTPRDYKREDDTFTLLHHTRNQLEFFVLCIGSLPLEHTTHIGDALNEFFVALD